MTQMTQIGKTGVSGRAVIILAIDTTTRGGSVAVTGDDEQLSLVVGDESRTHGERVPGEIAQALQDAGLARSAIDLIAVAAGPGAFTGLRIGLATAQGLALTLERPVVGVSALDALASTVGDNRGQADDEFVGAWMDAQRGDVFAALYHLTRAGNPGLPPQGWIVVEEPGDRAATRSSRSVDEASGQSRCRVHRRRCTT